MLHLYLLLLIIYYLGNIYVQVGNHNKNTNSLNPLEKIFYVLNAIITTSLFTTAGFNKIIPSIKKISTVDQDWLNNVVLDKYNMYVDNIYIYIKIYIYLYLLFIIMCLIYFYLKKNVKFFILEEIRELEKDNVKLSVLSKVSIFITVYARHNHKLMLFMNFALLHTLFVIIQLAPNLEAYLHHLLGSR